jgi:two-component system sensor histidine kinase KdpD
MKPENLRSTAKAGVGTFAILLVSTLLAFFIRSKDIRVENILIVYVLSILIVVVETKSFGWGIVSSFYCTLSFNYFFTEPRHTLVIDDPSYLISLGIFLAAAFIVSTLTSRLQSQIALSSKNQEMSEKLYRISEGYLNISERGDIVSYGEKSLASLLGKPCSISLGGEACATDSSSGSKVRRIPILKNGESLGVLKIDCSAGDVGKDEWVYMETILAQFVIALDRESLHKAQEANRINIEKERLRNSLLRSISHDLRTPLTAIAGGSEFLLEHLDTSDLETIRSLLSDINSDAVWLGSMVENLLNMAKIQDGKLMLEKRPEVVDDIVAEAVSRIAKNLGGHRLIMERAEGILLAPMDARLIIQVLLNLIGNAISHTRPNCSIFLGTRNTEGAVEFSVSDDGGGLSEEALAHLFESFAAPASGKGERRRGVGLGLSICKAIVRAHGGDIRGWNNDRSGATFAFTLPVEEVVHGGE